MKRATIYKDLGETPLEAIERFRKEERIPNETPLAYAGRLDPMAEGKLLVLVGEECKRQGAYHSLDKEYEFEVLFGFNTDTGDILGLAEEISGPTPEASALHALSCRLQGAIALPYPTFSSKTVRGKPLFLWTLEGRLREIEIPTAATRLFSLTYAGPRRVTPETIRGYIHDRIGRITTVTAESKKLGEDFRRVPILKKWDELLYAPRRGEYVVVRFTAVVSSGTYIRSLAPHIATLLGGGGLAYSIKRTRIGRYLPIPFTRSGFWVRSY